MLKDTVNGKGTQGNSAIIDQLAELQNQLEAIAEKVEPTPAKYPDTFEQAAIFAAPYVKRGEDFHRECLAFQSKIDAYMMQTRKAFRHIPSKGNAVAWTKTLELLESHFDDQCHALMRQASALGDYYRHIMHMAAMACDCDIDAMTEAIKG